MAKILPDPLCPFGEFRSDDNGVVPVVFLINTALDESHLIAWKTKHNLRILLAIKRKDNMQISVHQEDINERLVPLVADFLANKITVMWANCLDVFLTSPEQLDDPFLFQNHLKQTVLECETKGDNAILCLPIHVLSSIVEETFWKLPQETEFRSFYTDHITPVKQKIIVHLDKHYHGEL